MHKAFLDTSVLVCFLSGEEPEQQKRAKLFFERLERNELQVIAAIPVIADTVAILSSPDLYNLSKASVSALLKPLLQLKGVKLRNRTVVLRALDFYVAEDCNFTEALVYAEMFQDKPGILYSFEDDLDPPSEITKQAP